MLVTTSTGDSAAGMRVAAAFDAAAGLLVAGLTDTLRGADALAVTSCGVAVVAVVDADRSGELTVTAAGEWRVDGQALPGAAGTLAGLRAAASDAATRLAELGVGVPAPLPLLVVTGGVRLVAGDAVDVGGIVVTPAEEAAAVLVGRAGVALRVFNTNRGVYPRDVPAVDVGVLRAVLAALRQPVDDLPGEVALAAQGLGTGGLLTRDAGHAAAALAAALTEARPDTDVLVDVSDPVRMRHREDLVAGAVARAGALGVTTVEPVELVFADDDVDGTGVGVVVGADGTLLYVPADAGEPVRAAWVSGDGAVLGALADPVTPVTLAALPVVSAASSGVVDVHQVPRVRVSSFAARVAQQRRLTAAAREQFATRLELVIDADVDLRVKQGRSGEHLVWAEAALPLGSARLAYTEYYTQVSGLPSPKTTRLEVVSTAGGKPVIVRVSTRTAVVDALRDVKPAVDLALLPEVAAEIGPLRRSWFGRRG